MTMIDTVATVGQLRLSEKHRADLRASGLTDETIDANGYQTLTSAGAITILLHWRGGTEKLGPCMAIPYFRADGTMIPLAEYCRLRPDTPRVKQSEDGKPPRVVKYEAPKGSSARLYFPPATCKQLADPPIPLLITEGEKKAAKAAQEGFACVGLSGVEAWSKRRETGPDGRKIGERELLDDFSHIPLDGREVYIVFDSDISTKPEVQRAESAFAQSLAKKGAIVKCVRLPDGPPDENGVPQKVGLDDYLLDHSADDLRALIAEAITPQATTTTAPQRPIEAADDPHRLARLYAEKCGTSPSGEPTLHYWRDEWHEWDGSGYATIPAAEIKAEMSGVIKAEFDRINLEILAAPPKNDEPPPPAKKVTTGLLNNVMSALTSLRILPGAIEQPAWLIDDAPFPASEVIATKSALVHLPSLISGKPSTLPPTPLYFSAGAVDYPFDPAAQCPRWMQFLADLWPDDPQAVECLQEWAGYLLLPDTSQHKLLVMIGPPRSGKGTIGRLFKTLIGARNVATPTLNNLAGPFGLWPLAGKTVAILPDARLGSSADAIAVVERLLSISGEDPQDIHRKNLPTITGAKLPVRFVLMSNELPNLRDSSGAFAHRIILLRMKKTWLGGEDKQLSAALEVELPGILNWSIAGWQRLQERGHFIQPDSGRELLTDLHDLTSPVSQFVRERCDIGPEFETPISELFAAWKQWSEERGRHNVTEHTFAKDLKAKFPGISTKQRRCGTERFRVFEGVGLQSVTRWHACQPIAREGLD